MEYIERVSVRSTAVIGMVVLLMCAGLVLLEWNTAHAAGGFGSLTVMEVVSGGMASPSDFTVEITQSGTTNGGVLSGSGDVITFTRLLAAPYILTESGPPGYSVSWSGNCTVQGAVTIAASEEAVCTATNTFTPTGSIKIVDIVSGGSATPTDFTVHLTKSGSADTGVPSGSGSPILFTQLIPGTYTLSESGVPSGYSTSWSGACDAQGSVAVVANTTATCTLTNTFSASGGTGTSSRTSRPTPVRQPRS